MGSREGIWKGEKGLREEKEGDLRDGGKEGRERKRREADVGMKLREGSEEEEGKREGENIKGN